MKQKKRKFSDMKAKKIKKISTMTKGSTKKKKKVHCSTYPHMHMQSLSLPLLQKQNCASESIIRKTFEIKENQINFI